MPHPTLFSLSLCTLLAANAMAQEPRPPVGKADARADARAEARGDHKSSDSSRSSQTVTHRVVVVNGKTIVDERTENGRPAPAGRGAGSAGGAGGLPPLPELDAEEMLRKLREQVERDIGGGLPPLPVGGRPVGGLPVDGRRASDRASDSSKHSDSSKQSSSSKNSPGKVDSAKDAAGKGSRPASDRGRLTPRTDKR